MRFRALPAHIWIVDIFHNVEVSRTTRSGIPIFYWVHLRLDFLLAICIISFMEIHWPGDHSCKVQGVCTAWVKALMNYRRLLLSGSIFSTLLCNKIQGFNFNCAKVPSRWINRRNNGCKWWTFLWEHGSCQFLSQAHVIFAIRHPTTKHIIYQHRPQIAWKDINRFRNLFNWFKSIQNIYTFQFLQIYRYSAARCKHKYSSTKYDTVFKTEMRMWMIHGCRVRRWMKA